MNELEKTNQTTEMMPFFVADAGGPTGFESVDNDCISIPFLRLAQSNTPQVCDPTMRINGLQAGQYFNPSTGRIYGESPRLVILGFYRSFSVWQGDPPNSKFQKTLTPEDYMANYEPATHKDERGKIIDGAGYRYVDSRNFFVMSYDHPEDNVLLYCMTSTGIPASKRWLSKASAIKVSSPDGGLVQAPMWARIWKPQVSYVQGDKGNYYQMSNVIDDGWIAENAAPIIKAAFDEVLAYDKARVAVADKDE